MATTEEKQETIEALKGPRFYRLTISGYGGEGAYINISEDAYKFWKDVREEHGSDGDFIQYLTTDDPAEYEFDDIDTVPVEADFLAVDDEDYKHQWYEAPTEFCHQYGVEYGSAWMNIEEVSSLDYSASTINDIIENQDVSGLVDKIGEDSDYEIELSDHGEGYEFKEMGAYCAQMYSSEKGTFFDGTIEINGEFDVNKLKFMVNEYPNGEDIIDGVEYAGEEIDNNGGDTNGKGYYAEVWANDQS
jgi:hypothetical protein|tara:strand:+ start:415 stop:1152 length:738 start_codon:yes stop_codon:yes gene_type:complete